MSETHLSRYGPWLLGLIFVGVWLLLIYFLAVDGCLDAGGRVADEAFNCETRANQVVSLLQYVGPIGVMIGAAIAAIPVGLILAIVHGGRST